MISKEKLAKMVFAAKRHWWLFLPVMLIIILGYVVLSVADSVHILALRIRNVFLFTFKAIAHSAGAISSFTKRHSSNAAGYFKGKAHNIGSKFSEMRMNAKTACDQILTSSVEFCLEKQAKRENKKAELREAAKALSSNHTISVEAAVPAPENKSA